MQRPEIETLWINPTQHAAPLVVFLHEGLGSVALWRDFPKRFCDALNLRGLVFSRKGYGQSTPRKADEHWPADFMHQQAIHFLPALFESLGIDAKRNPPILFGHSDGATIALIYAATYPDRVRSVLALAPHIMIEDITIEAIRQGKVAYETPSTQLKTKLARYHADVDSAFYGWCDAWLSDAFQSFDIRALLPNITCPVLAVQGVDDAYGTMAQIDDIAHLTPKTQLLKLTDCGHSPHIDQPEELLAACRSWSVIMLG
ncbi:MAG: alpha/beta hydrolase [Cytophagales bacterium]|nr:alpha/beta hydrolase [Cytophagales bacterium]